MSHYNEHDHDDNEADVIHDIERAGMKRIKRGEEINITRLDPTIREITLGVGWDLKRFEGDPVDLDVSLFLLDKNDKTREDEDFVFYNNSTARDGAVRHMGDSRTGAGDGDDEKIIIDLMALPYEVVKIAVVLSIYDMDLSANNFTMVKNAYFRIVNNETTLETFRHELDEDLGHETGILVGVLERVGSEWIYKAQSESVRGGLNKIATEYGIVVAQNVQG